MVVNLVFRKIDRGLEQEAFLNRETLLKGNLVIWQGVAQLGKNFGQVSDYGSIRT